MNEYNLEQIEKLRIHELRDFAKQIGISSPTTMKKEQLIERIYTRLGEDEVTIAKNNKFPSASKEPLDFFALLTSPNSNLLDELIIKTSKQDHKNSKINENCELSNTLVMKKSQPINDASSYIYPKSDFIGLHFKLMQNVAPYGGDFFSVSGYVDVDESGYGVVRHHGFVPDSNDSFLTLATVRGRGLKSGDFVSGKSKFVLEGKPRIMYEVETIDRNPDEKVELPFDSCEYCNVGDTLYLDKFNFEIHKGERIYIKNMNIEDTVKFGYDIVDENMHRVKLVNVKVLPEEAYKSDQKLQIINCLFNVPEDDVKKAIELVVERIKREFEDNKPNVLILYNFSEIIRQYNIANNGFYSVDKFNARAVNQLANIMFNAKYYDEKRNVTIVCIDKEDVKDDTKTVLDSAFMPLFNRVYDMYDYKDNSKQN